MDEIYERPEKETNLSPTSTGSVPFKKNTQKQLRINTYSQADLHDRYLSSEEEPSPSPDSDTESNEEQLKHEMPEKITEAAVEPVSADEYEAEIAVAIPIIAMRPKLIDITNLAPMHKRKRTKESAQSRSVAKNTALRMPTIPDATDAEAIKVPPPTERLSKRKDSSCSLASGSELPNDGVQIVQKEDEEDEDEDENYFPSLELRKAPTYDDYDPYLLSPPRLSPRNSYNTTSKKPGSVARARKNSKPPIITNGGWKGLTRSMSLAKRQTLHRADHQVSKRPKMIARAANEREEPLKIPAFPFRDGKHVG